MESLETSARTVEEAVEKALKQLGLDRSQVEVEILSEGRPRILGFGGEPARVIVRPLVAEEPEEEEEEIPVPVAPERSRTPRVTEAEEGEIDLSAPAGDSGISKADAVAIAVEILEDLLDLMHVDAAVSHRPPTTPGDGVGMVTAVLDVTGDDLGMLIGRRGETLASLQYLVNLLLARRIHSRLMVGVDVGGYRRRREESLRTLAKRMAERVRSTGQSVTLEPMPPNERRIVHIALQDSPDVLTVSIGEGEGRKVAITPRR